mmetsp:Transcript_5004/g.12569  ORF Transcript_5004/g.12569 Transcript_5004/m.12569 type:complete len:217 (-) Transcript_5004:1579-2229(-)
MASTEASAFSAAKSAALILLRCLLGRSGTPSPSSAKMPCALLRAWDFVSDTAGCFNFPFSPCRVSSSSLGGFRAAISLACCFLSARFCRAAARFCARCASSPISPGSTARQSTSTCCPSRASPPPCCPGMPGSGPSSDPDFAAGGPASAGWALGNRAASSSCEAPEGSASAVAASSPSPSSSPMGASCRSASSMLFPAFFFGGRRCVTSTSSISKR